MKKPIDITTYYTDWAWAKKIRFMLHKMAKPLSSKEIVNLILFQDTALGYKHDWNRRQLENKTAAILKVYYDRREINRAEVNGVMKYRVD